MSEPEQCIICLDSLPLPRSSGPALVTDGVLQVPPTTVDAENNNKQENDEAANHLNVVAALDGCEHIIHDACIRSWAQKTNTCPICRNIFHIVRVFNGVDGTAISQYEVEDKKQIAEFDIQQWLGENAEEEPEQSNPCPICNSAEQENVLLLCDSCDAAYHTHCVGLDDIPDGDWYCMECRHAFQLSDESGDFANESQPSRRRRTARSQPRNGRGYHVRTRARLRRARQQARNVEWQGPWGQFAGRLYDLAEVDLDNFDDEDEEMGQYRQFQQLDRREVERWRQRFDIAQRWGAQDAFAHNIPPAISEHLQPAPPPPPPQETRDERRAWGAFELARAAEEGSTASRSRKRKTRSITASPAEPTQEPERKLKRPRTRRLATTHAEGSGSGSAPSPIPGPSTTPAADATTNGHGTIVNGSSARPEARTSSRGLRLLPTPLRQLENTPMVMAAVAAAEVEAAAREVIRTVGQIGNVGDVDLKSSNTARDTQGKRSRPPLLNIHQPEGA
ncbi:PHD and RING finger domain-containing protein-like protein [Emericellopsis cladophorae]|uniref:PHD and RING finger domain-containing protein-like protein n=1 Tax=Emericellopsis cladophorae TaxID=2686198 RepID=A0A9P9Y2B3_9HYPO|nr:PHD and RING finger domain-containing protein-like protein [Emericellopsis cladophorae]KAI6782202.1 PHD and RING finger domain-containing protein-like protein [Emericellopsis cladophorae]